LRIPPYGPRGADRVDDDRRVRSAHLRGSVRVVEKIPGGVLGVPTVDDQRGGAGTERCDVIVQGLVLRGNRYSAEMQEPAAEPLCGPAEA
jgi:hypothetical protein